RFVGGVFGSMLTLEVFFAFFLESVFLGVMLQGWKSKRISDRVLWFSSLMVAVGSVISAFWILCANSWMHTPGGFTVEGDRAVLTDFWQTIMTPSMFPRFFHTINACLITGSFFIIGVSAWYLLKNEHTQAAQDSIKAALIVGIFLSLFQIFLGHWNSTMVAEYQPAKFAAQEAIFETESGVPLVFFAILDETGILFQIDSTFFGLLDIPLLSILLGNPNATVTGLDDLSPDTPPVMLTFYSFHLMVILGGIFILVSGIGVILLWRKKLFDNNWTYRKWYLRLAVLCIPLPILANELGWITTEVGRQPWIVQDVMRTVDGVSTVVPAEQILISLTLFILTYVILTGIWILIMRRIIMKGPVKLEVKN
ncbi:MAG: cytochrome ubiquinol oxidase subunit I, partial [Candidatus Heimdallarchaeota archaeon]